MDDLYKTIEKPSRKTLFKDRHIKFYGYAFPISSEADISTLLEHLKKKASFRRSFLLCLANGN